MCQCSYRKPVSHLCSFNLPSARLKQQVYVCVFLTSRVQASHSPITPTRTSPPSDQGDSSFLCQIPGLSCPICDLNCSIPRVGFHPCILLFPSFFSQGHRSQHHYFSPLLPDSMCIFHTTLLQKYFCQSLVSFQWDFFPHTQVYFWCVHRQKWVLHLLTPLVSSISPYHL